MFNQKFKVFITSLLDNNNKKNVQNLEIPNLIVRFFVLNYVTLIFSLYNVTFYRHSDVHTLCI